MTPTSVTSPDLGWQDILVLAIYFAAMLGIGAWFKWKETHGSTEEYLMGNRSMPWWLVGIAYVMTLLSTNSLVSIPGEAFNHGLSLGLRYVIAPFIGIGIFYVFIRFFFRSRVFTPFTYLEERFDRRVRALGSLFFITIRLFYLALVLYSAAILLRGVAGWPLERSILVIGVGGLIYVYLGGAKALIWADFVQFLFLAIGLGFVGYICVAQVEGGFLGIFRYAMANGRGFEAMSNPSFLAFDPYVRLNLWLMLFVTVSDRLFYSTADQLSVQRLLSTKNYRAAERSYWFSQILTIPTVLALWFLGLAIFAFYGQNPITGATLAGDTALFRFVTTELPPFVPGLFVAACIGLIMSTLDAGFHSLSTVLVKDVYRMFINPQATDRQELVLSRTLILLIGLFAMGLSLMMVTTSERVASSFIETNVFWISFQGLIAMVFLIGVTSCRVTAGDILRAFVVASLVTCVTIYFYVQSRGTDRPLSFLFVSVPGEIAMLVCGYLPGIWRNPLPRDKIEGLTLFTLAHPSKPTD